MSALPPSQGHLFLEITSFSLDFDLFERLEHFEFFEQGRHAHILSAIKGCPKLAALLASPDRMTKKVDKQLKMAEDFKAFQPRIGLAKQEGVKLLLLEWALVSKLLVHLMLTGKYQPFWFQLTDRLGLLYDLTSTIAAEGLEIYICKAATVMDQVADTFYLKDEERKKVGDEARLSRLRAKLLEAASRET